MANSTLVLRDIHQPAAPSWWPPAPGWWVLFVVVVLVAAVGAWVAQRRARRRRDVANVFDRAVDAAITPPEQIAAISELLRRAARRRDPAADRLQGEDWLEFLDRNSKNHRKRKEFADGAGRLLLDGAYRRDADPRQVAALRALARARFLEWMGSA